MRPRPVLLLGTVCLALIIPLYACREKGPSPQSIDRLASLFRHSEHFGTKSIYSRFPLSREEANGLPGGIPAHPSWAGRVAVQKGAQHSTDLGIWPEGAQAVVGDYLVYGDPALVREVVEELR